MMNTKLQLCYSDGSNFKQFLNVILKGEITDDQLVAIQENLDEDEYMIAFQVGLPTISELFADNYEFPTAEDHVWTQILDFEGELSSKDMLTSEAPTLNISVDEFVSRITSVVWDEIGEMERLGIPVECFA